MRTVRPLAFVAVFVAALLSGGCQNHLSPIQEAQVAADTLTATQDAFVALRQQDVLTARQNVDAEPYFRAAQAAVAEMFTAAEAGESDGNPFNGFSRAYGAFYAALSELKRVQSEAERRKLAAPRAPPHVTGPPEPAAVDPELYIPPPAR